MAQTFQGRRISEGSSIDHTPAGVIAQGDVVVQENVIGIATRGIAATVKGSLDIAGVFAIVKKQEPFATVGAPVFWDATGDPYLGTGGTGAATATVGANRRMGFVEQAALTNDETVRVILRSSLALTAEAFALADLSDVDTVLYTSGHVLLGDGTSKYADVAMSGDATIVANGALTIAEGAVEDTMLEALADGEIFIGVDGTAANNAIVVMSGDALLANDGTLTLADVVTLVIADPGDAGAIPVVASGSCAMESAGGGETRTLAIPPVVGRMLSIIHSVDAGDIAITAASAINQAAQTIMTFTELNDHIMLIGVDIGGTLAWKVVCNDGVALS